MLDKKNVDGDEMYLIHWKGKHRLASSWHRRDEIEKECPHSVGQLDNYDRKFSMKCEQVRVGSANPSNRTSAKRGRKVKEENSQEQGLENENEGGYSMIN